MRALTRRDLITLLGGSAAGILLTPVPWKLTDDVAIWTQNWGFTPRLPRGAIETRLTTCGLCPAACPLRVRTVAGVPFQIAPAASDHGALCPVGFGGHQMAWHPSRLRGPVALRASGRHEPIALDAVRTDLARAIRGAGGAAGRVAILDARPGRSISLLYRRFLEGTPDGLYLTAQRNEARSLDLLASMAGMAPGSLGWDLDRAGTILSFGAPILDGWTGSSSVIERRRSAEGADRRPRILQAETRPSRTALAADRWLPIRPGSEGALALAIAHVMIHEGWCDTASLRALARDFDDGSERDYRHLIESFPPDRAAKVTGLGPEQIAEAAAEFALKGPSIAVGGGDPGGGPLGFAEEVAIQGLNLLSGATGKPGVISGRRSLPAPAVLDPSQARDATDILDAPEGSIGVLIIDGAASGEALPWPWIERVMVKDRGVIVSLSPYRTGAAARATYVVPAAAHLEAIEEAVTPPGAARASFAVTAPLLAPPPGAVDSVEFLRGVAAAAGIDLPGEGGNAHLIEGRARAIFASGRGELVDPATGSARPTISIGSADDFWAALRNGSRWREASIVTASPSGFRLLGPGAAGYDGLAALSVSRLEDESPGATSFPLALMPFGLAGAVGEAPVAPLVSKVYRETRLRTGPGLAVLHPETAALHGVRDGARVVIETAAGSVGAVASIDPMVMPGVIHAAAGPDPDRFGESGQPQGAALVDLCARTSPGCRAVRARVREV